MKAVRNDLIMSVIAALATTASAQTYTGTGGLISNTGVGCGSSASTPTNFGAIDIAGNPGATSVAIELPGLNHTWAGDLLITVSGPAGYSTTLMDRPGANTQTVCGNSSDFLATNNYRWANSGPTVPEALSTPIPSSTWRPTGNLGIASTSLPGVPTGADINGIWNLTIRDWGGADEGSIAAWRIVATPVPEPSTAITLLGPVLWLCRRRCARANGL